MASSPATVPQGAPEPAGQDDPGILAAVDLGSNSFHMIVARFSHGQITVIDRLREMVRLAAGLDDHNRLKAKSQERALACLGRFGERLREMRAGQVRVVGTNTLRKARNARTFLDEAAEQLGHPVEIISGIEEARLIYLGVSHSLPMVDGPQIVVDIGGGSTEIVRGTAYQPEVLESLYMGCVAFSRANFANGKLSARRFERARLAARLELEPVKARFLRVPVARLAGASGTIRACQRVLRALDGEDAVITPEGLERLIARMIKVGKVERLDLPGLSEQRKPVFAGGVTILAEIMRALEAEEMVVADGALREGIVYDLLGRLTDEDARLSTVRSMMARYAVDTAQAERVEKTALHLLDQVAADWGLDSPADRMALTWSARLHEIGLDIAHAHYHRHGAYLLEHADMPGFPREEQRLLARLVAAHRRSFPSEPFDALISGQATHSRRLAVLLRLAVLFNRNRVGEAVTEVKLVAGKKSLRVDLPSNWLEKNPLTHADLKVERGYLHAADVDMAFD